MSMNFRADSLTLQHCLKTMQKSLILQVKLLIFLMRIKYVHTFQKQTHIFYMQALKLCAVF